MMRITLKGIYKKLLQNEDVEEMKKKIHLTFLPTTQLIDDLKFFIDKKIVLRQLKNISKCLKLETYNREKIIEAIQYSSKHPNQCSLSYDVTYNSLKYNVLEQEAKHIIKNMIKNKTTNIEGFIKRHGKVEGLKKFKEFQKTSKYSSSDEWYKNKFGDDWENQKHLHGKQKSKRHIEYWIKRGYTEDESKEKVLEFQKETSGLYREFWKIKGYTDEEIDIILKTIDSKKKNTRRNREYLKQIYGNKWFDVYQEEYKKHKEKMIKDGHWLSDELLSEFKKYHRLVWLYTRKTVKIDNIEGIEMRGEKWHLDHKFSIKQGFINNIPAEIIGSPINLEIIPSVQNLKKRDKCSISMKALLKEYYLYMETQNED